MATNPILQIDPEFDALMPDLSEAEYRGLELSLIEEGCRDPLVVWKGLILDGHNRYRICSQHRLSFRAMPVELGSREEAMIWIIDNQIHRRNLNAFQRGELALKKEDLLRAKARNNQGMRTDLLEKPLELKKTEQTHLNSTDFSPTLGKSEGIDTEKELARLAQVSHGTMSKILKIDKKGTDEQKERLRQGQASINEVYKQIRTGERREERVQNILKITREETESLDSLGKFPIILADPPWKYEHSYTDARRVDNKYPVMSLEELSNIDIASVSCEDCLLFMWVVNPKVDEAIELLKAWGFTYRTNFVWVKDKIGMGIYGRQRHELLFVARRGNIPVPKPEDRQDSVIEAPRTEHSRKPDKVYDYIEKMYPSLPKLELFARQKRQGWTAWGNELKGAAGNADR